MKKILLLISYFALSNPSFAGVAKSNGSTFTIIPPDKVQDTCGDNFVFRDQYQETEVPKYLSPIVIKKAFEGKTKFYSSLEEAKKAAHQGKKCIWFASSEKSSL
ncbi:MAG: hypothetical protein D6797_07715 [Bdellovibrio sp.]|nr:MAG: hypothetical protein D6797_07715 [Bdellovibrio sp.]